SDTGDGGWKVAAYTAQLGNGVSASLSFEEPRRQVVTNASVYAGTFGTQVGVAVSSGTFTSSVTLFNTVINPTQNVYTVGALPLQDELKVVMPDIVANLRIDQAWGSAQVMGALHQIGGGYYGNTLGANSTLLGECNGKFGQESLTQGTTCAGHPDNKFGYAVGAGIKINFPMIGPGDYLQAQVNYTLGAERYAALTPAGAGSPGVFGEGTGQGSTLGMGWFQDGVYCGAGTSPRLYSPPPTNPNSVVQTLALNSYCGTNQIQLTTAWSVQAAYEHFWTPSLRTSLVGAYTNISYNAAASQMMCGQVNGIIQPQFINGTPTTPGSPPGANPPVPGSNTINNLTNCGSGSFDWSYYSISSRTQWNITKDFYVGLEGYYGHLNTMSKGQTVFYATAAGAAQPSGIRTLDDQNVYVYRMRVHRDIVP
ncbi:MAG: hypothetical protein QOF09_1327, partial [Alphaproteobacteria bacterium]|nr:hypothetical protein [Alphaproteobacteria bacterium]